MSIDTMDLLRALRPYIAQAAEGDGGYGFFPGGDPRDFSPDEESSTEEERAAHKTACEAWERGERPVTPSSCSVEHVSLPEGPDGAGGTTPGREGMAIVTRSFFGLGTYRLRDEEAEALLARIDAALSPRPMAAVDAPPVLLAGAVEHEEPVPHDLHHALRDARPGQVLAGLRARLRWMSDHDRAVLVHGLAELAGTAR